MAEHEQMRPASRKNPPDPANSYERSHPKNEPGQGKLTHDVGDTPVARPDQAEDAVSNKRKPKELEQAPES
jgi:hypothetical protein